MQAAKVLDADTEGGLSRFSSVSPDDCRAVLAAPLPRPCSPDEAIELAEAMMKRMPFGDGQDKETWLADMTIVFCRYPKRDVELMVLHPVDGIRSKQKWLPSVDEVMAFLAGLASRRGRILTNARRVLAEHERLASEPKQTEEERQAMAKRIEAKLREFKGQRPLGEVEDMRTRQAEFNDYARWRGGGDLALGIQIAADENIAEAPAGWREKCGWQGEVA